MDDLIRVLPALALRGMTILPDMVVHFDVSRNKSKKAIEQAMIQDQKIFLITQKDSQVDDPEQEELYKMGVIASVKQVIKLPHNLLRILVEGEEKAELCHLEQEEGYLMAEVVRFEEEPEELQEDVREAMFRTLTEHFSQYCQVNSKLGKAGGGDPGSGAAYEPDHDSHSPVLRGETEFPGNRGAFRALRHGLCGAEQRD